MNTLLEEDKKIDEKRKLSESLDLQISFHRTKISEQEIEMEQKAKLIRNKETTLADLEEYIKTGELLLVKTNEQEKMLEEKRNELKKLHEQIELEQEKLRILIEHNTRQREAAESGGTEDIDELLRSPRRTAALLGVSVSSWETELEHKKKQEALNKKQRELENRHLTLCQKEDDLNQYAEQISQEKTEVQEQKKKSPFRRRQTETPNRKN